jgi:F-type H+-transporting ATPase subunit b
MDPGDEPMSPALAFVMLNFLIFAFILVWKAGPAVSSGLERRHNEIRDALAEAARLREQARAKLEEYRRKVANADREIATIVDDIKGAAESERERVMAQAQEQAEGIRRDTRERIEAELVRARAQIEREVVARAVEVATELLRKNASNEDHNALLTNFVRELESTKETRS